MLFLFLHEKTKHAQAVNTSHQLTQIAREKQAKNKHIHQTRTRKNHATNNNQQRRATNNTQQPEPNS